MLAAIKFAVGTVQSRSVDAVKGAKDPGARLRAFFSATVKWAEQYPDHASLVLLLYYYASYEPDLLKLHSEIRRLGAERIAALVGQVIPAASEQGMQSAAASIQASMTGHLLEWLTTEPKLSAKILLERIERDADRILRSIA